jgi:ribosomal protein S18 acetylase RimI-like enzyme
VKVRAARPEDGALVAELFYSTDPDVFDRLCGDGELARSLLEDCFERPRTATSRDVVAVAEVDGRPAGAMAAFALSESEPRGRTFYRLLMRSTPPWRWPGQWRLRREAENAPEPPRGSFYVDSLATAEAFRRRGVATALLAEAERRAREHGCATLAIDTGAGNDAALATYERAGFRVTGASAPPASLPGYVGFVKEL